MKSVVLDKIASVTRNCALKRQARVTSEIPCEEGVVVAIRLTNDKSVYNQLELPSGRMAQLRRGDVVAGCLGHRHALFGYSGRIPERLAPGDTVNLLNLGGVIGLCESVNPDLGRPFEGEVLGAVLSFPVLGERIGAPGADRPRAAAGEAAARHPRRAGDRPRRQLHERGQDRRRRRPRPGGDPPGPGRRRLQGDRRLAAPRHPRAGGRRLPADRDLHRPRRRLDHRRQRAGGDEDARHPARRRARPTRSWSSSATACSAPTGSTRSSPTPSWRAASPPSCSPPTTRSPPGAACGSCARPTASSRRR